MTRRKTSLGAHRNSRQCHTLLRDIFFRLSLNSADKVLLLRIIEKLREATGNRISVEFKEDNRLLAGLRIGIGPWVLRANLQDELEFFNGVVSHGP